MFLFCPFHSDDAFCALLPEVKATWWLNHESWKLVYDASDTWNLSKSTRETGPGPFIPCYALMNVATVIRRSSALNHVVYFLRLITVTDTIRNIHLLHQDEPPPPSPHINTITTRSLYRNMHTEILLPLPLSCVETFPPRHLQSKIK